MSIWHEVERQYGLRVLRHRKIRDVFMLQTQSRGTLCLKPYHAKRNVVRFIANVLQFLRKAGFPYSPGILPAGDGSLWISLHGKRYMVTNWISGKSPDFSHPSELEHAIRTLALFHRHATGFPVEDVPDGRFQVFRLPDSIRISRRVLSEHARLEGMNDLIDLCDLAADSVLRPGVERGVAKEYRDRALVHGDYNYPNLMKDKTGMIHLIDFDNTSLNVRMEDLAHILHRNCAWDGNRMARLIEVYNRARPLGQEDCDVLRVLLTIPYPVFRAIRQFKQSERRIQHFVPNPSRLRIYKTWLENGI